MNDFIIYHFYPIFALLLTNLNLIFMKKFAIFLISAILLFTCINLSAQNPYCEWDNSPPRFSNLSNLNDNIIINEEDGCQFRFIMKDPINIGWSSQNRIEISVDGVDFGSVTLPWGTPYKEEIIMLPSGEVEFFWIGPFSSGRNCFEIYNTFDILIYESPMFFPSEGLFFTYQNECPECLPLTDFEGAYNQETKVVNLTWVAPDSEYLTGFDVFRNGVLLARVDSTVNSYSSPTDTLETGDYKYCVVPLYLYSCFFEDKCFEIYINNVGIKNYSFDIQLYPNPANNELRITNYELRITNVEIYDVFGRKVGEKFPFNTLKGWTAKPDGVVINISHLPAGVYIVKIFTDQGEVIEKIIKQ